MITRRVTYARLHAEQCRQKFLQYKLKHPEARKATVSKWDRGNQKHRNAIEAARRAAINQTPKWLLVEEREAVIEFYKNCPDGFHVDHIIPLKGVNVTGWHCLANLQYLPALENIRKGNKLVSGRVIK